VRYVHQPEAAAASSLSDQAYYRLRELIITLELPPGSAINERDLMARTGLGRTPIREALRTLANERLVEIFPRRGVLVAGVNAGDLAGLSEVRRLLEPPAARAAAARRTAADRAETEELLAELAQANGDERSLIELDQRIHRHVYGCTHNPFLSAALGEHYLLSLRIWFLALDRVEELGDAVREHRELLEAIRDGDGDAAEAAMLRHVDGFERAMRAVL
jgi:DNA-binding GntR family transcriptional regulator